MAIRQQLGSSQNIISAEAGEAISQYDICYITNGTMMKAQCDGTESQADAIAISLDNISLGSTGRFAIGNSKIKNISWNYAIGTQVYVSSALGEFTTTEPTTNGYYVKPLGYFIATNTLLFSPQLGYEIGSVDELDGDQLVIDWNPSNSTPTVVESYTSTIDQLTSHLKGIDTACRIKSCFISYSC